MGTILVLSLPLPIHAAAKNSLKPRTPEALEVDKFFWDVFNNGKYEQIPAVLEALTGVYLANTDDYLTASHIGWAYAWQAAESERMLTPPPPTITNDFILSRKYFARASFLKPSDGRFTSGEALMTITEGMIHNEANTIAKGYQIMNKGIKQWPEFNLFTDSYLASRLPIAGNIPETTRKQNLKIFKKGLDNVWRNVDVCIGKKIDRQNPDMTPYMYKKVIKDAANIDNPKTVCWDAEWMAPHNFEGFFLHMGDMVVKSGDWQVAKILYANAKLDPAYDKWAYKDVLEARIANAQANVAAFNELPDVTGKVANPIMANSKFACLACHQN